MHRREPTARQVQVNYVCTLFQVCVQLNKHLCIIQSKLVKFQSQDSKVPLVQRFEKFNKNFLLRKLNLRQPYLLDVFFPILSLKDLLEHLLGVNSDLIVRDVNRLQGFLLKKPIEYIA